MSISYKKVNSVIDNLLNGESGVASLDSLTEESRKVLSNLTKEIYMLESTPDANFMSSKIKGDIKGKITMSANRIIGEEE